MILLRNLLVLQFVTFSLNSEVNSYILCLNFLKRWGKPYKNKSVIYLDPWETQT